jgi:hypothetical protein
LSAISHELAIQDKANWMVLYASEEIEYFWTFSHQELISSSLGKMGKFPVRDAHDLKTPKTFPVVNNILVFAKSLEPANCAVPSNYRNKKSG